MVSEGPCTKCRNYQTPDKKLFSNTVGTMQQGQNVHETVIDKQWDVDRNINKQKNMKQTKIDEQAHNKRNNKQNMFS